ncbi:tetratricopeptide repeat protein [Aurantiacibacter hainanensis]|uniref:tetratricopeptide repeat protein n=1 Tax=Aurantiacibacter hainanensis TaxID=3076114 RepID=UPI0030C72E03
MPFAIARGAICAGLVAIAVPMPAVAQVNDRLDRIERQINALQREVFPGGDERFFEPEITPEVRQPQNNSPEITTSALTDVLSRLDSIEGQLARLTAATEVNENALAAVEARLGELEDLAATYSAPPTATSSGPSGVIPIPDEGESVDFAGEDDDITASGGGNEAASGPSPQRVEAVQAIAKPATGDAGDDEYVYGFRLWDAGFYPEAQQQLSMFVERYPDHWRTTYGRNLLGRAFLDAGEPRAAATHFFENYQSDSNAARAPDSLLYLAESMIALGDTGRACIALAEFGETYAALAAGRLADQYGSLNGRVDCN